MYEVRWPNKERWIFIFCDYPGEPDEFVVLLKHTEIWFTARSGRYPT